MEKGVAASSSHVNLDPESDTERNDPIKSPPDSSRDKTQRSKNPPSRDINKRKS